MNTLLRAPRRNFRLEVAMALQALGAGSVVAQRALVSLLLSIAPETSRLPERCEEYFALLETIVDAAAAAAVNSPAEAWAEDVPEPYAPPPILLHGFDSSMELLLTTTTTTGAAADAEKEGAEETPEAQLRGSCSGSFAVCCCGSPS